MIYSGKLYRAILFDQHKYPYTNVKQVYENLSNIHLDKKLIVTNSHWYNPGPVPCGNYKVNGEVISQEWNSLPGFAWSGFNMPANGSSNMEGADNFLGTMDAIIGGKRQDLSNQTSGVKRSCHRTWWGFDKSGKCFIEVTEQNYTLDKIVDRMADMGIADGLVLDGSGSSQWYDGNTYLTGDERTVYGFLALWFDIEKTIYRVQVGAFKIKSYAETLRDQLIASGYTGAFIQQKDGIYRVQLGAFSVKANAEALAAKLKAQGVDCFIVTSST